MTMVNADDTDGNSLAQMATANTDGKGCGCQRFEWMSAVNGLETQMTTAIVYDNSQCKTHASQLAGNFLFIQLVLICKGIELQRCG